MSERDYLGEFEHVVLLAVLRLGDQAYGVTVRREIEARTKREVSIGATYATLDRLEAKGYVRSRVGDPTPERGGRSKRFFRVTAQRVAAVNRTQLALRSLTEGLDVLGIPWSFFALQAFEGWMAILLGGILTQEIRTASLGRHPTPSFRRSCL